MLKLRKSHSLVPKLPTNKVEWTLIGLVGKPHALKGEFYIGGRSSLLSPEHEVCLVGSSLKTATLSKLSQRIIRDRSVVRLEAYPSRTHLEAILGQSLWGKRDIEEGPLGYLLGRRVIDADKVLVGTVVGFTHYGASEIICIESESCQFEVPFVESYFSLDLSQDQLEMCVPVSHIQCFSEKS